MGAWQLNDGREGEVGEDLLVRINSPRSFPKRGDGAASEAWVEGRKGGKNGWRTLV